MGESLSSKRLQLFLSFLKIGAFTFGGGYAMIPLIQREMVENRAWISDDDILEIIAIAESTPGPIAINSATFVGYRVAGFLGALCATVGVVLPSFCIILLLSGILTAFQNASAVKYAFFGIRCAVLALVIKAVWSMFKKNPKNVFSCIMMGGAFVGSAVLGINVLWIIIAAAAIGIVRTFALGGKLK